MLLTVVVAAAGMLVSSELKVFSTLFSGEFRRTPAGWLKGAGCCAALLMYPHTYITVTVPLERLKQRARFLQYAYIYDIN